MTWVLVDDTMPEHPRWDDAGAEALALHVAALAFCNRNLTDGVVPKSRALRLLTLADAEATVAALIRVGAWRDLGDDVELVDYLKEQKSKDDVLGMRAETAARQRRSRAHRAGDHSLCTRGDFCPNGALSRRDRHRDSRLPTQPNPTRREGEGEVRRLDAVARALAPSSPPKVTSWSRATPGGAA